MASHIVTVFKNGDANFSGKKLVVNKRQIRTMGALLDKVTTATRMKQAARTIKTPTGRHTINQLDSLEAGGCYVAVGSERFVPLAYTEIKDVQTRNTPRKEIEITPVKHSRLQMSARARKVAEAHSHSHKTIHVFRNGDELQPSIRMLLDKRELISLDSVLKIVTKKVRLQTGAVFWLFTLDGKEIKEVNELENGGQYVAVGHGKKFKKVAYSDDTMLSPRSRAPTKIQGKDSRNSKSNRTKSQNTSKNSKRKSSSTSNSQASSHEDNSNRKPIEEFQEAITEDVQEEFTNKLPGKTTRKSPDNLVSDLTDKFNSQLRGDRSPSPNDKPDGLLDRALSQGSSGVYQASGENQEKAKEVQDDREIQEDKPIDQQKQQKAEEVDEEILENESDNQDKGKKENQEDQPKPQSRENSGLGGFIADLVEDVRDKLDSDDEEQQKDENKKNNTDDKDDK